MNSTLLEYFRFPEEFGDLGTCRNLTDKPGFFQFGQGIKCYGQYANSDSQRTTDGQIIDVLGNVRFEGGRVELPFDFTQIINNLRLERYPAARQPFLNKLTSNDAAHRFYYSLRPFLSASLRKHFQRVRLRGWQKIPFPRWHVDFTVESLMEQVTVLKLKSRGMTSAPFIWFWPDGARSCAIMTHDVEDYAGLNFCSELMNMDDQFAVKSAFQIIPEERYEIDHTLLDNFRARGFEINVHDLNHDGFLFLDRHHFEGRAKRINQFGKDINAEGFRSGALYRNQEWFDLFDFAYDMSVPNVAHLEPQRGGCCTVLPYFIGKLVELPVTTIQDYSLFHILGDYSTNLWEQQIEFITRRNGLVSFITHPDYLIEKKPRKVYSKLLDHLANMRDQHRLWIALPREVNSWWRNRNQMHLLQDGNHWRIEGPDSDRARIAYATLDGDCVVYSFGTENSNGPPRSRIRENPVPEANSKKV
jgi:hypothetical protein